MRYLQVKLLKVTAAIVCIVSSISLLSGCNASSPGTTGQPPPSPQEQVKAIENAPNVSPQEKARALAERERMRAMNEDMQKRQQQNGK